MVTLAYDLYPRLDPKNGARLVRFTKLKKGTNFRVEARGTGAGYIVIPGDSADAAFISPLGMDYIRVYDLDVCITKTLTTSAAADDKVDTTAAHGFVVGNIVEFTELTGGTGLSTGVAYHVVAVPSSTEFQVSATGGGTAINFTTNITAGTVRLLTPLGGFFLEKGDYTALQDEELKDLKFGGAGTLSYLARAIMAEETYLDSEGGKDPTESGSDIWNLHLQGTWIGTHAHSLIAYLHRCLREATHADRPRQPLAALTWDFNASTDSTGAALVDWEGEFVANIGETVLSVCQRLMQLGMYVWMDGDFNLHAYNTYGRSLVGGAWGAGVVRFQAPSAGTIGTGNIESNASRALAAAIVRSDILVGSQLTYVWAAGTGDLEWEGAYRIDPGDADALEAAGDAQIAARERAGDVPRLRIKPGTSDAAGEYTPGPQSLALAKVWLNDNVTLHSGTGAWDWDEATYPTAAWTWDYRVDGLWDVYLDMGDVYKTFENRQFEVMGGSGCPCIRLCGTRTPIQTDASWKALDLSYYNGTSVVVINSIPSGWGSAGFDDSAWDAVEVPSSAVDYDMISHPDAGPTGRRREEYLLRKEFTIAAADLSGADVAFHHLFDDGGKVYVNGTEVASVRTPYNTAPTPIIETAPTTLARSYFVEGVNVVGIWAWNRDLDPPGPSSAGLMIDIGGDQNGTSPLAARCDHVHTHNDLEGRSFSGTHPDSAVTDPVDGTVETALALLRARAWKQPVRAASTANGTLATAFENGDTLDGVTLATGDRILLKDQTAGAENGIYTVNASGAPTRSTDMDASSEALLATVNVSEGTANADKTYKMTTNAPITLGTTALVWSELSGGGTGMATDPLWDTKGDLAAATGANAAVKLPVGSNGQLLQADSAETTGMKWVNPPAGARNDSIFDIDTAGSSSTSTTLADSNMSVAVKANTTYAFRAAVYYNTAATTTAIRLAFTVPTGCTLKVGGLIPTGGANVNDSTISHGSTTTSGASIIGTTSGPGATNGMLIIEGTLIVGSTAGNLTLQYASEVASSAVSIEAGSYLMATPTSSGSGTSFPAAPATGERFWRTDLRLEFFWDGTRWLSTTLYLQPLDTQRALNNMSATSTFDSPLYNDLGLWLEKFMATMFVVTTNDGTKYWTAASEGVTLSTISLAANTTHYLQGNINAVKAVNTGPTGMTLTKVSTPGSLVVTGLLTYRLIGT